MKLTTVLTDKDEKEKPVAYQYTIVDCLKK